VKETLHHVWTIKSNPELETWHSRLGYDELGRARTKSSSDLHLIFKEALGGEVLAEGSPGKIDLRKLAVPIGVVLARVDVDGLIDSAVHREIRLLIAIQVER